VYVARYYAPRYYPPRYFPEVGADAPPAPQPGGGYFLGRYFNPGYFPPRYFPGYTPVTGSPSAAIAWIQPAPTWALTGSSKIVADGEYLDAR
jgi:hypothetical protein